MKEDIGIKALRVKWAKWNKSRYTYSIYHESLSGDDVEYFMCDDWRADREAFVSWGLSAGWKPYALLRRHQINLPHGPDNSYWIFPDTPSKKENI